MKFSLTPTENQVLLLQHIAANPGCHPESRQSNTVCALLQRQLITNAVLHVAGVMISVWVRLDRQRLWVEVEDDSQPGSTG